MTTTQERRRLVWRFAVIGLSALLLAAAMVLALSSGSGSELWSPMGVAVIGGLIFSSFVTMILVPVVYAVFVKRGERKKSLTAYSDLKSLNGD